MIDFTSPRAIHKKLDDTERENVRLRQALRDIEEMPFSMVNDSESLRHSIKTMQTIARTAARQQS